MKRVTADTELLKRFFNFTDPVEVYDESGCIIADVAPRRRDAESDEWEELTPPVSEEELDRRANSNEATYSTQEVIEMLKKV